MYLFHIVRITCSIAKRSSTCAELAESSVGAVVVGVDQAAVVLAAELGDVAPHPAHPQVVALTPDH